MRFEADGNLDMQWLPASGVFMVHFCTMIKQQFDNFWRAFQSGLTERRHAVPVRLHDVCAVRQKYGGCFHMPVANSTLQRLGTRWFLRSPARSRVGRCRITLLEYVLPDFSDRRRPGGVKLETETGRGKGQRQEKGRHAGLLQSCAKPAGVRSPE